MSTLFIKIITYNTRLYLLAIAIIVCLAACNSNTESLSNTRIQDEVPNSDLKEISQSVNTFFKKYQSNGTSNAIDFIFRSTNVLPDNAQLNNLKFKLDSTRKVIGNYYGNTLITKKSASPDLIMLTYLVKHQKQPIRFTFIFYKPNGSWVLYKFQYDDEIISELEDSGKIYFIK